ncbi:hypothetical protein DL764_003039 [Monosporascus ibericus]|uniref:Amidohydrolase-related domain-containing protein n=1 Tax=Monosporascus ibericus TaxID=155417 RepID=A0A4Q4TI66_9PEZI|nr:hypothetical protein DL764_003039 [Monosporascus ibericus]
MDPADGVVRSKMEVRLAGGLIQYVNNQGSGLPGDYRDSTVVDVTGKKYICPGLIDRHIHLSSVPGDADLTGVIPSSPTVSFMRQPFARTQMLGRGFTTCATAGARCSPSKEAIMDDVFLGPRLFIANSALSQTGGHGASARRTTAREQARCAVAANARQALGRL